MRYVERPDGRMEMLEIPLTREDYLNPQLGDKWSQGRQHGEAIVHLFDLLKRCFQTRPDMLVLCDVQHVLGPGLPNPCPDLSVVCGARDPDQINISYNFVEQGVPTCLIIEVISPRDAFIREIDEHDKVEIYQRARIPEYLLLEPPHKPADRHRIFGYRLDPAGTYQRIVPDREGRLFSETTGLWFSISPEGDRVLIWNVGNGTLLRTSSEEERDRKAAERALQVAREKTAAAEAKTTAAEIELARLNAEIERLREALDGNQEG